MPVNTTNPLHPAAAVLQAELPLLPRVALVCGSGFVQALHSYPLAVWSIADLPALPAVSVKGHGLTLELHVIREVPVLVFTGRYHLYEGHSDEATMAQIDVARSLGVRHLLLTNASGGLHQRLRQGDIVLINDVIDATYRPMPIIAHRGYRTAIDGISHMHVRRALTQAGLPIRQGVYAQVLGPSYETRSEVRMLRRIGCDLVGMSTAREAVYASSHGLCVLALSLVTNVASDVSTPQVSHQDVLHNAQQHAVRLAEVLETTIPIMAQAETNDVSLRL